MAGLIQNIPPMRWASRHPRLFAWVLLSIGMIVLLVLSARDVGLLASQWAALLVVTVLVAGVCIWIISWEDDDEFDSDETDDTPATTA